MFSVAILKFVILSDFMKICAQIGLGHAIASFRVELVSISVPCRCLGNTVMSLAQNSSVDCYLVGLVEASGAPCRPAVHRLHERGTAAT